MSLTTQERDNVKRLRRKYRIKFIGEVESHEWPNSHHSTFSAVQTLGKRQFDSYADSAMGNENAPWTADIANHAKELSERAKRCVRRNESTWRFACEPYALARLTSDVACKKCRKRVWRSEIEATSEGDSVIAEALCDRQSRREPCRCSRDSRNGDFMEAVGLNQIFGHREDELIYHESAIKKELLKGTKPDAIYGLRQTRNIQDLMYDRSRLAHPDYGEDHEMLVHESLGEPPLSGEGDPLVFPFLLLEAKSAKSYSDWHSVQLQSAFPVRTLLRAQETLKDMSIPHATQQLQDPLLWLVMNKGEDWRICAAYVYNEAEKKPGTIGTTEYRIVDLWGGPITSNNGALQLLLIVDYVFEWARDTYREDILKKLRIMASGEHDRASMIHPDTDIMSTLTSTYSIISNKEHGDTPDSCNQGINAFEALDSQQGIVRHATFVQSQYRCFFVTRDNVTTMLHSIQDQVRKVLVKQIMTQLRDEALLMSGDCLRMMEKEWTGHSRISRHHLDQVNFYTSVTYASFVLPKWTQVRELSVIAVAEDACQDLATASMYNPKWLSSWWPPYKRECEIDALKTNIMRLHAGDTKHILLAAIQRVCISVRRNESQIVLLKSNAISRDIVHYIYNDLKREQIESEESFLHTSISFDQVHLSQTSLQPFEFGNINASSDGCVLVYAGSQEYDVEHHMSSVCVFFTDGPPNVPTPETLGLAIRNTFENYDVYHTSRVNRVLNFRALGKDKAGTRWNIKNSYGIFLAGFDFVDWISSLGCEPPSRQGSSRPGTSTDLFSRNFYPWRDPDHIDSSSNLAIRVSLIYKIINEETQHWQAIAKEFKEQGIACCDICTREVKIGDKLCDNCNRKVFKVHEASLQNALLGEHPIHCRPISSEPPEFGRHPPSHFNIKQHERNSPNVKFETHLSFDEGLDGDYNDIEELRTQAMKFDEIHRESVWPSIKRRGLNDIPSETDRANGN